MRFATDAEAELFDRLRWRVVNHHERNSERSEYAQATRLIQHLDTRLPSGLNIEQTPLHWPQKAIDVFTSRLATEGFRLSSGSALEGVLKSAYSAAQGDFVEHLAIASALRHGCSFVFAGLGDEGAGEPEIVLSAASALTATADIDPRTRRVTAALEMLADRRANLYLPGVTLTMGLFPGRLVVLEEHEAPARVMCAPYIVSPTIEKPYGQSRITNTIMALTRAGMRTFARSEVSASLYQAPRERLLGMSADDLIDDDGNVQGLVRSDATTFDAIPDVHPDDDPLMPDQLRRVSVDRSPQMSMQPYSDQFRLIASQFSGASSIPLSYLGIVQDSNPTSAEAIWAQDIDLVRSVRGEYPSLNYGRRLLAGNILTLAKGAAATAELGNIVPRWVDPWVHGVTERSNFVSQQVQAGNFQPGIRATLEQLPLTPDEIDAHVRANQGARATQTVLDALAAQSAQAAVPGA